MSRLRIQISQNKVCNPDIYLNAVRNICPILDFVSYEECKKWARKNNIRTAKEYIQIKRPFNIPREPHCVYRTKGWTSWADFLGTENYRDKKYVSYHECKSWAKNNNIKSRKNYHKFKKPTGIPSAPYKIYLTNGWTNWADFLGTENNNLTKKFISFNRCKKWVKNNKIKTCTEYQHTKKPNNVPYNPNSVYKNSGWKGWPDFLENNNHSPVKNPVSYKECKKWAKENNIKTQKEYNVFKKPDNIPCSPNAVYKNSGWINWSSFLDRFFVIYEECKQWAATNKIKTQKEYKEFKRRPKNIPSNPNRTYENKGWTNWADFLDTDNYINKEYVGYEKCKIWAKKNKIKSQRRYFKFEKPFNMPYRPDMIYKNKGWTNWYDFLGKKKKKQ